MRIENKHFLFYLINFKRSSRKLLHFWPFTHALCLPTRDGIWHTAIWLSQPFSLMSLYIRWKTQQYFALARWSFYVKLIALLTHQLCAHFPWNNYLFSRFTRSFFEESDFIVQNKDVLCFPIRLQRFIGPISWDSTQPSDGAWKSWWAIWFWGRMDLKSDYSSRAGWELCLSNEFEDPVPHPDRYWDDLPTQSRGFLSPCLHL